MAGKKASEKSNVLSRRAAIKGAAAAVLAGGLMACQDKNANPVKQKRARRFTQSCSGTDDHTGMLGVWLALVRDGRYCDRLGNQAIGTWDANRTPDSIARALVPDMFPSLTANQQPAYIASVSQLISDLRQPLSSPPGSFQDLYIIAADHLAQLSNPADGSNIYSGADCPRFYQTVKSVAQVMP